MPPISWIAHLPVFWRRAQAFRPARFCGAGGPCGMGRSALFGARSHSFSAAIFCEKSLITKRRRIEFYEIAVIAGFAPYCSKFGRVSVPGMLHGTHAI